MVYMDEIEAPDHSMERHFDRSLNFGGTGNEGKFVLANAYSRDGIHWRMNVGNYIYFEPPIVPNGVLFGWDPRRHLFVH